MSAAIAATRADLAGLEQGGKGQLEGLDLALAFTGAFGALWERGDAARRKLVAHLVFDRISVDNAGQVVDYRLASPFSYLAELKKACSPPSRAGRPFGIRPLGGTKRNVYRTGKEGSPTLEELSFAGRETLLRSGLLDRLK